MQISTMWILIIGKILVKFVLGFILRFIYLVFRSSLYIMALENDVKTVEFLLNHGANTELKDRKIRKCQSLACDWSLVIY